MGGRRGGHFAIFGLSNRVCHIKGIYRWAVVVVVTVRQLLRPLNAKPTALHRWAEDLGRTNGVDNRLDVETYLAIASQSPLLLAARLHSLRSFAVTDALFKRLGRMSEFIGL